MLLFILLVVGLISSIVSKVGFFSNLLLVIFIYAPKMSWCYFGGDFYTGSKKRGILKNK
jgi:hypothetical protein